MDTLVFSKMIVISIRLMVNTVDDRLANPHMWSWCIIISVLYGSMLWPRFSPMLYRWYFLFVTTSIIFISHVLFWWDRTIYKPISIAMFRLLHSCSLPLRILSLFHEVWYNSVEYRKMMFLTWVCKQPHRETCQEVAIVDEWDQAEKYGIGILS